MKNSSQFLGYYVVITLACMAACCVTVAMKLFGVVDYSWGWALSPLWIPMLMFAIFLSITMGIISLKNHFDKKYISRDIYD